MSQFNIFDYVPITQKILYNMIVPQKAVLQLFTAGLPAVSCIFVATWRNLIWLSSLLAKADEIQNALNFIRK